MGSPTQRSLQLLRSEGWIAEVVESHNTFSHRKNDLFGFADLVAMKPGETPLLVQTTSGSNLSARRQKIAEEPRAAVALQSGFRIVLHGWRKLKYKKADGTYGKSYRWHVISEDFTC